MEDNRFSRSNRKRSTVSPISRRRLQRCYSIKLHSVAAGSARVGVKCKCNQDFSFTNRLLYVVARCVAFYSSSSLTSILCSSSTAEHCC